MTFRRLFVTLAILIALATIAQARDISPPDVERVTTTGDQYWNTHLLANFVCGGAGTSCEGVSGYSAPDGTQLAIIAGTTGTTFVDVTRAPDVYEVAFIPGQASILRTVATYSGFAYIVNYTGGGMQIVDLSDPLRPTYVGTFDSTFTRAEDIGIFDGYAYIDESHLNDVFTGLRIIDLSTPSRPREVGSYLDHNAHDSYARGNLAYLGSMNGFTILDVQDKARPREISFTGDNHTHSIWTSKDGRYAFTTQEFYGSLLRIWDLSDLQHPSLIGSWAANPTSTIHKAKVKGDSLYIAYYSAGFQLLDISNPSSPNSVAYYDFWPTDEAGYCGNYEVYPFTRNGTVYLSGMRGGLYVVSLGDGPQPQLDFEVHAPPPQAVAPGVTRVEFLFEVQNAAAQQRDFRLKASASSFIYRVSVLQDLSLQSGASQTVPVRVEVPPFTAGSDRPDVYLRVRSCITGLERLVATQLAVPVEIADLQAVSNQAGVHLTWQISVEALQQLSGVQVQRADAAVGPYVDRTAAALEPAGGMSYFDSQVEAGRTYWYRLVVLRVSGPPEIVGPIYISTTGPRQLATALQHPYESGGGTIAIPYTIAHPQTPVHLAIYDVGGRLVRSLEHGSHNPGEYVRTWDRRDATGTRVVRGVYLIQLDAAPARQCKKLVVLAPGG